MAVDFLVELLRASGFRLVLNLKDAKVDLL